MAKLLKKLGRSFLDAPASLSRDAMKALFDVGSLGGEVLEQNYQKRRAEDADIKLSSKLGMKQAMGKLKPAQEGHRVITDSNKNAAKSKVKRLASLVAIGSLKELADSPRDLLQTMVEKGNLDVSSVMQLKKGEVIKDLGDFRLEWTDGEMGNRIGHFEAVAKQAGEWAKVGDHAVEGPRVSYVLFKKLPDLVDKVEEMGGSMKAILSPTASPLVSNLGMFVRGLSADQLKDLGKLFLHLR